MVRRRAYGYKQKPAGAPRFLHEVDEPVNVAAPAGMKSEDSMTGEIASEELSKLEPDVEETVAEEVKIPAETEVSIIEDQDELAETLARSFENLPHTAIEERLADLAAKDEQLAEKVRNCMGAGPKAEDDPAEEEPEEDEWTPEEDEWTPEEEEE